MSDDRAMTPPYGIPLNVCAQHSAMAAEVQRASERCEDRQERISEAVLSVARRLEVLDGDVRSGQLALAEIAGRDGREGKVGELRKDIDANTTRIGRVEEKVDRLALKVLGGGVGGGAIVAALVEAWLQIKGG